MRNLNLTIVLISILSIFIQAQSINLTVDWSWNKVNMEVGSIQQVSWESQNVNYIKIEYSTNAGKSWNIIEESYSTVSGVYDWLIPNSPSVYCMLRISDVSNSTINDSEPEDQYLMYFTIYDKITENKPDCVSFSSPTEKVLSSIKFMDVFNGIAWGNEVLIETNNGGTDWRVVSEFERGDVTFIDKENGWKVVNIYSQTEEDTSYLMQTNNGGIDWKVNRLCTSDKANEFGTNKNYSSISFVDSDNGWLSLHTSNTHNASEPGLTIYKTTNGGKTWDTIFGRSGSSSNIKLISKNIGWVQYKEEYYHSNEGTSIQYTINGGTTWSLIPVYNLPEEWNPSEFVERHDESIVLGSDGTGFLISNFINGSGYVNVVSKLENGNWQTIYRSIYKGAGSIRFVSDSTWVMSGNQNTTDDYYDDNIRHNYICVATDSGLNWELKSFSEDRIGSYLLDGEVSWAIGDSGLITRCTGNITHIISEEEKKPSMISLFQNYPNPFNPSTTIKYTIPQILNTNGIKESVVQLKIYDVLGKQTTTLVNKQQNPGSYEVNFNSVNFSSGIYFYKLQVGNFVETKKMILMK